MSANVRMDEIVLSLVMIYAAIVNSFFARSSISSRAS